MRRIFLTMLAAVFAFIPQAYAQEYAVSTFQDEDIEDLLEELEDEGLEDEDLEELLEDEELEELAADEVYLGTQKEFKACTYYSQPGAIITYEWDVDPFLPVYFWIEDEGGNRWVQRYEEDEVGKFQTPSAGQWTIVFHNPHPVAVDVDYIIKIRQYT